MDSDTSTVDTRTVDTAASDAADRPWAVVAGGAAALAAAMGVGRFAFTPILPLMQSQAGLTPSAGASLATANYAGYLAGSLAGIAAPALLRSPAVLRGSLLVLVASLGLMPVLTGTVAWSLLRLFAGAASALVFVIAIGAALSRLRARTHLGGWVFGGVGGGIALSGVLVLVVRDTGTWQHAWWACTAATAALGVLAWRLTPQSTPEPRRGDAPAQRTGRWFAPLLIAYTLEGIGYIIAGTFLVAAIEERLPGMFGAAAWVLVGLAALPSCAAWMWAARRWSRPTLLTTALVVQAAGIVVSAFFAGVPAALISAVLFGATFMGITTLALGIGTQLRGARAVAVLTAGYSVGQIVGPVVAAPVARGGYDGTLLLSGALVLAAAATAAAVAVRFPHHHTAPDHTAPA